MVIIFLKRYLVVKRLRKAKWLLSSFQVWRWLCGLSCFCKCIRGLSVSMNVSHPVLSPLTRRTHSEMASSGKSVIDHTLYLMNLGGWNVSRLYHPPGHCPWVNCHCLKTHAHNCKCCQVTLRNLHIFKTFMVNLLNLKRRKLSPGQVKVFAQSHTDRYVCQSLLNSHGQEDLYINLLFYNAFLNHGRYHITHGLLFCFVLFFNLTPPRISSIMNCPSQVGDFCESICNQLVDVGQAILNCWWHHLMNQLLDNVRLDGDLPWFSLFNGIISWKALSSRKSNSDKHGVCASTYKCGEVPLVTNE